MVRAVLAGTKTQTRRLVKPQPNSGPNGEMVDLGNGWGLLDGVLSGLWFCPYGRSGDRLWVRETWSHDAESLEQCRSAHEDIMAGHDGMGYGPYYRATEIAPDTLRWRPAIHMPRWASRITLGLTDVRVERLQEVSDEDAFAEGIQTAVDLGQRDDGTARGAFRVLWDSINAKRAPWASNPWVWVLSFKLAAHEQGGERT
jgi:hypothetical protein